MPNHYQRLGVSRDATRAQLIAAAQAKNAELKAALAILTDPARRKVYDAQLARPAASGKTAPHPSMVTKIRYLGIAEGISFLLLLGVAMPLKYFAHYSPAVYWVGSAHGILFVLYLGYLITGKFSVPFPARLMFLGMLSAITPFAPFFVERKLRAYESLTGAMK